MTIVLAGFAWLAGAAGFGIVLGRVIRNRDREP